MGVFYNMNYSLGYKRVVSKDHAVGEVHNSARHLDLYKTLDLI